MIGYHLLLGRLDAKAPTGRHWKGLLAARGASAGAVEVIEWCCDDIADARPADGNELAAALAKLVGSTTVSVAEATAPPGVAPTVTPPTTGGTDLAARAAAKKNERETAHAAALKLQKEYRYSEALAELEKLSPERRNSDLDAQLRQQIADETSLTQEVEQAIDSDRLTWRLRTSVERLMILRPDRADLPGVLKHCPEMAKTFANKFGMKFVLAPAGSFWMGGGNGTPGDKHVVLSEPFYAGIHPVTQGQWQAVMGNNPSYFSRTGGGKDKVSGVSDADLALFPVETVSCEDVEDLLKKMNSVDPDSEWVYTLPTEAEWEYICRGGASSKQGCAFSYYLDTSTNSLAKTQANTSEAGLGRTSKVGLYEPNRLGIYDVHGNVWEWTADLDDGGPRRVIRGGRWAAGASSAAAAYRRAIDPSSRGSDVGFRLARKVRPK